MHYAKAPLLQQEHWTRLNSTTSGPQADLLIHMVYFPARWHFDTPVQMERAVIQPNVLNSV